IIARREIRVEFAGPSSGEDRQAVFGTRDVKVQSWNGGIDCGYAGGGTCNVLFFTHAGITAELRQSKRLALVCKTALGHGKTPLCASKLEVIASQLGDHTDLHVVKVRFERLVLGPSCRDSMANPSEKVGFPQGVEPSAKSIDRATLVPKTGNQI